jgi:hypothetical protein
MTQPASSLPPAKSRWSTGQLDRVAWSIFFIWVGFTMLVELPWGWFLLGIAVLILAVQFARWEIGANIEGFWVACGVAFLLGSLWQLLGLAWPLLPVLLILLGLALLSKAIMSFKR